MAETRLDLTFGDGEYAFRLTLSGINEIQSKCGTGIGGVWKRLASSRLEPITGDIMGLPNQAEFRIEDIVEVIRQGLIGGGEGLVDGQAVKVTPLLANRLIDSYVMSAPLQGSWAIAYAVVGALIEGYDPPKKKEANEAHETIVEVPMTDGSTTPVL